MLLTSGLGIVPAVSAETWTDSTGKFQIEASFERVERGLLYLKKDDGSVIAVPLQRLSAESVAQAKRLYEASQPSGNNPQSPPAGDLAAGAGDSPQSLLGPEPTARETARVLTQAMARFHLPTLWDALPPRYQADVQQNLRMQADAIPAATWNGVVGLLKNAAELVQTKREMFFQNPQLGPLLGGEEDAQAAWDAAAGLLAAIVNSRLTDQDAMKQLDVDQFIAQDARDIREAFMKLAENASSVPQSPFGQVAETPTIETLDESDQEATFRITFGDETTEQKFVKVDNRWLPADMVAEWDETIAEQRAQIAQMKTPEGQQNMMQMQLGLMMVGAPVNALLSAKTQAEFDQVIDSLAQTVAGMMGDMQVEVEAIESEATGDNAEPVFPQ